MAISEDTCREFASFIKDVSNFATGHPLLSCYLENHYSPDGMQECNAQYFPTASVPLAHFRLRARTRVGEESEDGFPVGNVRAKRKWDVCGRERGVIDAREDYAELVGVFATLLFAKMHYEGNGVGLRRDLKKPSVKGCWTDGSIDAETLGKFQLGYSPDFRAYGYDLMPPQMDGDTALGGKITNTQRESGE